MSENLIISAHKDTYYTAAAFLYKPLNKPDIIFSDSDNFHKDLPKAASGAWKNIYVIGMRLKNDYKDAVIESVKALAAAGKKIKIYIIENRFNIEGKERDALAPYLKMAKDDMKLIECINADIKAKPEDFERLNAVYKVLARGEIEKGKEFPAGKIGDTAIFIDYTIQSYWTWHVGKTGIFEELIIKLADDAVNQEEIAYAKQTDSGGYTLTGSSAGMKQLRDRIKQVSTYASTPVMIYGESGSGKEMVAGMIHEGSGRSGEFCPINCAGLSGEFMESMLFGHKKGAYTGAVFDKTGIIEVADKGTVFLDEITEMPMDVQGKLLRFLEDYKFRPMGDHVVKQADVRILAATNKDIKVEIREKRFREDLYYRLSGVEFKVPAIKNRKEDLKEIAKVILYRLFYKHGHKRIILTDEEYKALESYDWPGNFRQMQKFFMRVLIFNARGKDFKKLLDEMAGESLEGACDEEALPPGKAMSLAAAEKLAIRKALKEADDNKTKAAATLGVVLNTLKAKMKEYGIKEN